MEIMDLLKVTGRAVLSLITLFLITKMLGKKQVSQLSLFDYVIGISIGNFAAEMTINLDSHIAHGTLAVIIFGIVAYIISILTMKSICLRRYFMGIPTVLISNGKIDEGGLKKVKFDVNDLLEQCRSAGYFDISEINYAVMEGNGKISFLAKDEYQTVTMKDMKLKPQKTGLCANVVIDGKLMKENLKNINKTEEWLEKELEKQKVKMSDLLLAIVDVNDKVTVYKKNEIMSKDILE